MLYLSERVIWYQILVREGYLSERAIHRFEGVMHPVVNHYTLSQEPDLISPRLSFHK